MNAILGVLADGRTIAVNGTMPWTLDEKYKNLSNYDMKMFRMYTMDKSVLMGRKTWDSLNNKKLKGRKNHIILTNNESDSNEDNLIYCNEEEMKNYITSDDVVLMGGAQLYNKFLSRCKEVLVNVFIPRNIDQLIEWMNDSTAVKLSKSVYDFFPKEQWTMDVRIPTKEVLCDEAGSITTIIFRNKSLHS